MKRLMMVFAIMSLVVMSSQAFIRQKSYMLSQRTTYTNMGPQTTYAGGGNITGHLISWLSEEQIMLADGSMWQLDNRNGGLYHYRMTKNPDVAMPGQQLQEVVLSPDYSKFWLNYIFGVGMPYGGMQMTELYLFAGDGDAAFNKLSRGASNYNQMMR